MKRLLFCFLLLSANAFAQQKEDSIAIAQLLADDYKTLGNWDIKSHINHCTDNYLLIENGEVLDMEKERQYFIKNSSRTIDRKDFFDIRHIRVYGNYAYAVYYLRSDITENGQLKIYNWVENAVFRRLDGQWKIELIHSNPIDTKK